MENSKTLALSWSKWRARQAASVTAMVVAFLLATTVFADSSLLHEAIERGDIESVKRLLDAGTSPDVPDDYGDTPLHLASKTCTCLECLDYLLQAGADPNARNDEDDLRTPLHRAARSSYTSECVERLVQAGADPNARDAAGWTPLQLALTTREPEAVAALLQAGADPNAPGYNRTTPLHYAHICVECAERLVQAGADPNVLDNGGNTPLYACVTASIPSVVECIETLLQAGADPTLGAVIAAAAGRTTPHDTPDAETPHAIASLLLRAGADPNAPDFEGRTPLHFFSGEPQAVAELLEAGADPNAHDFEGRTPLHFFSGEPQAVAELLEAGADPSARDDDGRTPLHSATDAACAVALLGSGADPNARSGDGQTPLHIAARHQSDPALAIALLNSGADPHLLDSSSQTPLGLAAHYNESYSVVDVILKYHFPSLDNVDLDSSTVFNTMALLGTGLHKARCWFDKQMRWPMKDCFFMVVNEDPADASSSFIGFPIVKFFTEGGNSSSPAKNPLLHLGGGGPGSPMGLQLPHEVWSVYKKIALRTGRDLYVMDPRGVGLAHPRLRCPEVLASLREDWQKNIGQTEESDVLLSAYQDCKRRLDEEGRDLSNYNSRVVAQDVESLRRELDVRKWVLYGVSYGSRYALTIARDFPNSVETMILNGPVFPNLSGIRMSATAKHLAFSKAFAYCESIETCVADSLEERFGNLVGVLNETPLVVDFKEGPAPAIGDVGLRAPFNYVLTGSRLLDVLFFSLYNAELFKDVPQLVDEIERRKASDMLRTHVSSFVDFSLDPSYSYAIAWTHFCAEEEPFVDYASMLEAAREYGDNVRDLVVTSVDAVTWTCELWNVAASVAIENEPVVTPIPTLFLQGALDPATPIDHLHGQLEHFSQHAVVAFALSSHGGAVHGALSMQVAAHFIEHKRLPKHLRQTQALGEHALGKNAVVFHNQR